MQPNPITATAAVELQVETGGEDSLGTVARSVSGTQLLRMLARRPHLVGDWWGADELEFTDVDGYRIRVNSRDGAADQQDLRRLLRAHAVLCTPYPFMVTTTFTPDSSEGRHQRTATTTLLDGLRAEIDDMRQQLYKHAGEVTLHGFGFEVPHLHRSPFAASTSTQEVDAWAARARSEYGMPARSVEQYHAAIGRGLDRSREASWRAGRIVELLDADPLERRIVRQLLDAATDILDKANAEACLTPTGPCREIHTLAAGLERALQHVQLLEQQPHTCIEWCPAELERGYCILDSYAASDPPWAVTGMSHAGVPLLQRPGQALDGSATLQRLELDTAQLAQRLRLETGAADLAQTALRDTIKRFQDLSTALEAGCRLDAAPAAPQDGPPAALAATPSP